MSSTVLPVSTVPSAAISSSREARKMRVQGPAKLQPATTPRCGLRQPMAAPSTVASLGRACSLTSILISIMLKPMARARRTSSARGMCS
eukprot:3996162-Pyramimonas_sp.AAC.1